MYGKSWRIPVIDYMGYGLAQGHLQEEWIFVELQRQFKLTNIAAFIDIGTNIGQTLIKVKSLDPGVSYYGFDPNPNCIYYLNNLVRLNKLTNVAVSCLGLGQMHQLSTFRYAGMDDVCGTLAGDSAKELKSNLSMTIPVWPLDDIQFDFARLGKVVIKVDVEGYELEVFKGANNFLAKYNPIVFVEILPHHHSPELKRRAELVFTMFHALEYKIFQIQKSGAHVQIIGIADNPEDFDAVDYVFIPSMTE